MVAMSKRYIQLKDPNFRNVHSRITNDQKMFLHFKDCIGAIDGSHINANPQKKTTLDILEGVVNLPKMSWQFWTLICVSHMHQLDNQVQCMILTFCTMH
jgi:hypothetical protein